MAARAYWKGSLKLSLVTCPVMLYPATTSAAKTRFHMINKETGNRLKQQMVDGKTGEVVEDGQKGRGYELKKVNMSRSKRRNWKPSRSKATTPSISTASLRATKSTSAISTTPIISHRTARPGSMPSPWSATP